MNQELKQKICTFEEGSPDENPWVNGKPTPSVIKIEPYNKLWVTLFNQQKENIIQILKDKCLAIEHIGSTAVPELDAKPIIDIDLIVADPADEPSYIPWLNQLGYELTVREPSWYQHRMLKLEIPKVNLHVFAPNCPEHLRHILFRDWLINHKEDRELYIDAKLSAKEDVENVHQYNQKKDHVVKAIYQRIFDSL